MNELRLIPNNWRTLVLMSLITAQKIWNNNTMSNTDFSIICELSLDTEQINQLEMKFLELIKYKTCIKFGTYTKYYLELQSFITDELPLKPMDVLTQQKLEKQSKKFEQNLKVKCKTSENMFELGQKTKLVIN
jgi:hypothetical protein